jgi:hypothetical protein
MAQLDSERGSRGVATACVIAAALALSARGSTTGSDGISAAAIKPALRGHHVVINQSASLVNEHRIVLGRVRRSAIDDTDPTATAESVMEPGPSTVRFNTPARELAQNASPGATSRRRLSPLQKAVWVAPSTAPTSRRSCRARARRGDRSFSEGDLTRLHAGGGVRRASSIRVRPRSSTFCPLR